MKFKLGDRVRVATLDYGRDQFGDTGTVNCVEGLGDWVRVSLDPGNKQGKGYNSYDCRHLEFINPVPRTPFETSLYSYIDRELR